MPRCPPFSTRICAKSDARARCASGSDADGSTDGPRAAQPSSAASASGIAQRTNRIGEEHRKGAGSEHQLEAGPLGAGLEREIATARLRHRARDHEPEPGAAAVALGGEEALEDALAVALADAGAAVAHADHHAP